MRITSLIFGLMIFLTGCGFINREKIVVPKGYIGGVYLIKSNVSTNELVLDSNGIGYINESTFNNLKWKPIVNDASGKDLSENCVGYNPSAFWGRGEFQSTESKVTIRFLSFEVVPDSLIGKKQYYDKDLLKLVNPSKIK